MTGYEIYYCNRYYVFETLEEATRMAGDIVVKTGRIVNIGLSKRPVSHKYKIRPVADSHKYRNLTKIA